jgi:hypothetical protein
MSATSQLLHDNRPLRCGACGSKLAGRWESISKGLCISLIKFYETARVKSPVHLQKDCPLTKTEYANFQKLKYFGLVAKIEDRPGCWLLTRRGEEFVGNRICIPKKVLVFRNSVEDRSEETTSIAKAIGSRPWWLKREDFITPPPGTTECKQERLF